MNLGKYSNYDTQRISENYTHTQKDRKFPFELSAYFYL